MRRATATMPSPGARSTDRPPQAATRTHAGARSTSQAARALRNATAFASRIPASGVALRRGSRGSSRCDRELCRNNSKRCGFVTTFVSVEPERSWQRIFVYVRAIKTSSSSGMHLAGCTGYLFKTYQSCPVIRKMHPHRCRRVGSGPYLSNQRQKHRSRTEKSRQACGRRSLSFKSRFIH